MTRAQLRSLGLSDMWISRHLASGYLHRAYPGVYGVGRAPSTPLERGAAAVLACGDRAALSHDSAMVVWGLWARWTPRPHVTVAGDRRPAGVIVHRAVGLLRRDVRTRLGVRLTSPARTLLDCAPRMSPRALARQVNEARRQGLVTLAELADVVARFRRHPGACRLAEHAHTTQNPTRSGFEDDFLRFCKRFGLPTPRLNTTIAGYEVDALFEEERVIVELDGWEFHNDRDSFEDDRERDATMLALDLPTIRITRRRMLREPRREADRLHAILGARRRRAA